MTTERWAVVHPEGSGTTSRPTDGRGDRRWRDSNARGYRGALVLAVPVAVAVALVVRLVGGEETDAHFENLVNILVTLTGFVLIGLVFVLERRPRAVGTNWWLDDEATSDLKVTTVLGGVAGSLAVVISLTSLGGGQAAAAGFLATMLAVLSGAYLSVAFAWLHRLLDADSLSSRLSWLARTSPDPRRRSDAVLRLVDLARDDLEGRTFDEFVRRIEAISAVMAHCPFAVEADSRSSGGRRSSPVDPDAMEEVAALAFQQLVNLVRLAIEQRDFAVAALDGIVGALRPDAPRAPACRCRQVDIDEKTIGLVRAAGFHHWPSSEVLSRLLAIHLLAGRSVVTGPLDREPQVSREFLDAVVEMALRDGAPADLERLSAEVLAHASDGVATASLESFALAAVGDSDRRAIHHLAVLVVGRAETGSLLFQPALALVGHADRGEGEALRRQVAERTAPAMWGDQDGEVRLDLVARRIECIAVGDLSRGGIGAMRQCVGDLAAADVAAALTRSFDRLVAQRGARVAGSATGDGEEDSAGRTLEVVATARELWFETLRRGGLGALPVYAFHRWVAREVVRAEQVDRPLPEMRQGNFFSRLVDPMPLGFMRQGLGGCAEECAQLLHDSRATVGSRRREEPEVFLLAGLVLAMELAVATGRSAEIRLACRMLAAVPPSVARGSRTNLAAMVRQGLPLLVELLRQRTFDVDGVGDDDAPEADDDQDAPSGLDASALAGLNSWVRSGSGSSALVGAQQRADVLGVMIAYADSIGANLLRPFSGHWLTQQLDVLCGDAKVAAPVEFRRGVWLGAARTLADAAGGTLDGERPSLEFAMRPVDRRAVWRLVEHAGLLEDVPPRHPHRMLDAEVQFLVAAGSWLLSLEHLDSDWAVAIAEALHRRATALPADHDDGDSDADADGDGDGDGDGDAGDEAGDEAAAEVPAEVRAFAHEVASWCERASSPGAARRMARVFARSTTLAESVRSVPLLYQTGARLARAGSTEAVARLLGDIDLAAHEDLTALWQGLASGLEGRGINHIAAKELLDSAVLDRPAGSGDTGAGARLAARAEALAHLARALLRSASPDFVMAMDAIADLAVDDPSQAEELAAAMVRRAEERRDANPGGPGFVTRLLVERGFIAAA